MDITSATSSTDLVVQFFDRIFGPGWSNFGDLINSPPTDVAPSMIYEILSKFNAVALLAMACMGCMTMAIGALGTAHEGQPMGKKMHSIWVPLRFSFAATAIAPVAKGLSLAQVIILAAIGYSGQMANWINDAGFQYLVQSGGQVMLSTPQPMEDQARGLAAGVLRSLAIQRWRMDRQGDDLTGEVVATDYFPDEGSEAGGSYLLSFRVPTSCQGLDCGLKDGDFGAVEIPCSAQGDSLCESRKNAVYQMISSLQPLSVKLVSPDRVSRVEQLQALEGAAHNYTLYMASALQQATATSQSQLASNISEFKESAASRGWVMLGSYYWTISRLNERVMEEMKDKSIYHGPNMDKVSSGTTGDFEGVDDGIKDLAQEQINAAHVAESDSIWAIFKRFLNFIPAKMLNTSIEWMADGDIILTLSNIGHTVISSVETGIYTMLGTYLVSSTAKAWLDSGVGTIASWITGGAAEATAGGLVSMLSFLSIPIWTVAIGLYAFAFIIAYYIPALPYILWMSAVVGWILLVVESVVAAPLWVVAHSLPEGEGIAGQRAQQGYMLLLNILLRPPLMVAGMFFSYTLIQGIGPILTITYKVFATGSNGDHLLGVQGSIAFFVILVSLMLILSHKLFGIITHLPDNVIKWLGHQMHNLGEGYDEQRARAIFAAIGSRSERTLDGMMGGKRSGKPLGGSKITDGGSENDHRPGVVKESTDI